jgi:hypothetical protein
MEEALRATPNLDAEYQQLLRRLSDTTPADLGHSLSFQGDYSVGLRAGGDFQAQMRDAVSQQIGDDPERHIS